MSDLFQKKNLSQEEFTRQFKKELKKDTVYKFNEAGMEQLRQDYAEGFDSSVQLKNRLKDGLGIESISIEYQEMTFEQLQQEGELSTQKQKVLSSDMKKKASHSGKQSDQEKAANKRAEFNIQYDHDTATSVLSTYKEKAKDIKEGRSEAEAYTCTGKEFLLPPVDAEVEAGPAQRIVKVMLERDRLTNIIKNTPVGKSPYAKAKRTCDEKLLGYMNDLINTYMKANNVDQKTGGTLKEKEVKAAKEHMALAMEKYEMFARNYDMQVAELMEPSIKKSAQYKTSLTTYTANGKTSAENDEMELLNIISVNKTKVGTKGDNIKKVYAAFEKLNAKFAELNSKWNAINDYQHSVNEEEGKVVENLVEKAKADKKAVEFARNACKAYILNITRDEPMNLMDAAYIQKHFGITDASMSLGENRTLDMNKPVRLQEWGLGEYDEKFRKKMKDDIAKARADLSTHTEEEINADPMLLRIKSYLDRYDEGVQLNNIRNMINAYLYINPQMNRSTIAEMDRIMMEKYPEYRACKDHRGTRDIGHGFVHFEGDVGSIDDFEKFVLNCVRIMEKKDLITNEKPTAEEMRKAFDGIMPYMRSFRKEMEDYRKKYKNYFDGTYDLENPIDLVKNYEMFFHLGSKGQAINNVVETISKNQELVELLSEDEKTELFEMAQEGSVWMQYTATVSPNIVNILNATPEQILSNKVKLTGRGKNYENSYKECHGRNMNSVASRLHFKVPPSDVPKEKMSQN